MPGEGCHGDHGDDRQKHGRHSVGQSGIAPLLAARPANGLDLLLEKHLQFHHRNIGANLAARRLQCNPQVLGLTGAAMFSIQMAINVPATMHLASMRDAFHEYCEEQNLDAVIEPIQR